MLDLRNVCFGERKNRENGTIGNPPTNKINHEHLQKGAKLSGLSLSFFFFQKQIEQPTFFFRTA